MTFVDESRGGWWICMEVTVAMVNSCDFHGSTFQEVDGTSMEARNALPWKPVVYVKRCTR